MVSDNELIKIILKKPEKGLDVLIDKYGGLIYTIVKSKISNLEDIEECVSDVFYDFYKNAAAFDEEKASLKTYLAVIAKRKAIDFYRKTSKNEKIYIDDAFEQISDEKYNVESEVISEETSNLLIKEIKELGKPDSEIFIRKYFFGESTKIISKALNIKENTIDKKISRGLVKLKKALGGEI